MLSVAIPEALEKGETGTKEFKVALRDALQAAEGVVATDGAQTMSYSASTTVSTTGRGR